MSGQLYYKVEPKEPKLPTCHHINTECRYDVNLNDLEELKVERAMTRNASIKSIGPDNSSGCFVPAIKERMDKNSARLKDLVHR